MTDMEVDYNRPAAQDDMVLMDDEGTVTGASDDEELEYDDDDWMRMSEEEALMCRAELDDVQATFQDEIDLYDTTMVAEYADEIFGHMERLEVGCVPVDLGYLC